MPLKTKFLAFTDAFADIFAPGNPEEIIDFKKVKESFKDLLAFPIQPATSQTTSADLANIKESANML